jgi:hypothetical protein
MKHGRIPIRESGEELAALLPVCLAAEDKAMLHRTADVAVLLCQEAFQEADKAVYFLAAEETVIVVRRQMSTSASG